MCLYNYMVKSEAEQYYVYTSNNTLLPQKWIMLSSESFTLYFIKANILSPILLLFIAIICFAYINILIQSYINQKCNKGLVINIQFFKNQGMNYNELILVIG